MTLPWITTVNSIVTGQQVFPRTVAIHRMKSVADGNDAIGNVGYSGATQGTGPQGEVTIATGLAASIQLLSAAKGNKNVSLPTDATNKPTWNIFIPGIPIYTVRDRDIIIDDEGYRYEVSANYWTQLGYQLMTLREEA